MHEKLTNVLRVCLDLSCKAIYPLSRSLGKNKVRILCYHRVCDLPETGDVMRYLNVPPAAFAQQMGFLAQNGFNVITLEQFIDYKDDNRKPPPRTIIITFDDGYRDNYLNAFPILEKYNFNGTFFVVTDYIGSDKIFHWLKLGEESLAHPRENNQYWLPLSREEILEMSARGHCFGSHTKSHCSLTDIDESRAMEELEDSKEYLEGILQKPVRCFSYPGGHVNESVKNWVLGVGYHAGVAGAGSNSLESDFLELRRIPISSQDSLDKFVRKVEGAYDWWIEYLLPVVRFVQRAIFRGQGKR